MYSKTVTMIEMEAILADEMEYEVAPEKWLS